ncbi:dihydrolipoyl dehydrogenase [Thiohalomonas denitrificans]|uniref:Dihydrolipoamide dehydrogenase n=1 Tax=Thiohalomonas denitrificans TaxID=415747 RepID=A0A1G5Q6H4_9GAMM|nr:dihydrolipoyl dehydrogenase [Thiohalomonas denitrificans]SCZ57443.1 dihydrolipoamide dehydrogenase [Thiohalomonas denitrificans]
MSRSVKLVIIGAGTAGLTALSEARRHTDDVVLINDGPYGTTCARVGCMPSKALLEVAHTYASRKFLSGAGVAGTDQMQVDIPAVMEHVRSLRDRFTAGPIKLAESLGKGSIQGRPRFLEPTILEVNGERIRTEKTIIATGTRPIVPAKWQAFGNRVLTSDSIFEKKTLGGRGAVVGLGPIGAELGQAFAQLGVTIYGFDKTERVAAITDPAVNQAMLQALRKDMDIVIGEVDLEKTTNGAIRVLADGEAIDVDWVLAAIGRRPNLEGLDLDAIGVALDERGVPEYDPCSLQIGNLPIYIAGDVSGMRPLMHEAVDEGRIAAYHALTGHKELIGRRTPLEIVFTEPNVASAGLRYAELDLQRHIVATADFGQQPRALMTARNEGILQLYVDSEEGCIVGSEMATPDAEHLGHLLAWAIQQRSTVDKLLQMPFYHPTVEEGLRPALQAARRQLGERRRQPDIPLCHEAADWALGGD